MSGDTIIPMTAPAFTTQPLLRTYSRRALSRRATSPTSISKSVSGLKQKSQSGHIDDPVWANQGAMSTPPRPARKRRRLVGTTGGITPTDMFLEHISSSAPFLLKRQAAGAQEQLSSSKEDGDHTAASGDDSQDAKQVGKRDGDQSKTGGKAIPVGTTAAENVAVLEGSFEESDDDEASSRLEEWLDSLSPSPSYRTRIKRFTLLSATPIIPKSKRMNPSFAPSRPAPPQGFKAIQQSRAGQTGDVRISNSFKTTKSIGDGFTNQEARPGHCSMKARKMKDTSASRLDRLELTHKGPSPKKVEGPTWLRGQKRKRPVIHSSLWSRRQDFGSSHTRIESQDPVETFDIKEPEFERGNRSGRPKRHMSEILSDDADEPVDLLISPDEEEGDDEADPFREDNDEVVLLVCHDDQHGDADVDEEVDLISFPPQNTSEPGVGVVSSKKQCDF